MTVVVHIIEKHLHAAYMEDAADCEVIDDNIRSWSTAQHITSQQVPSSTADGATLRRLLHYYRETAISPPYNLLLAVRQPATPPLPGTSATSPHDSVVVVRRILMAMTSGDNRYPEGILFIDGQGSELKDLETLAVNCNAWRYKMATVVF